MLNNGGFELMKQLFLENNKNINNNEIHSFFNDESIEQFYEMSEEQLRAAQALEQQLFQLLMEAMEEGDASSDLAQEAVELHKRWLRFFLKPYTYEIHGKLAQIYLTDERFIVYYDYYVKQGATQFLHDAILTYVERATNE